MRYSVRFLLTWFIEFCLITYVLYSRFLISTVERELAAGPQIFCFLQPRVSAIDKHIFKFYYVVLKKRVKSWYIIPRRCLNRLFDIRFVV